MTRFVPTLILVTFLVWYFFLNYSTRYQIWVWLFSNVSCYNSVIGKQICLQVFDLIKKSHFIYRLGKKCSRAQNLEELPYDKISQFHCLLQNNTVCWLKKMSLKKVLHKSINLPWDGLSILPQFGKKNWLKHLTFRKLSMGRNQIWPNYAELFFDGKTVFAKKNCRWVWVICHTEVTWFHSILFSKTDFVKLISINITKQAKLIYT